MPRNIARLLGLASLLLVLGAGLMGCASNPPCDTTVTQVQTSQDGCAAATDELDTVRETRAELEAEVSVTKTELAQLEGQPEVLERRLHELRKGSGR